MEYHVLIVDDNTDQSELIQAALKRSSKPYQIDFTNSGTDAIEKCKEKQFDAIILDYKLPDLSGLQVLDKFRKLKINTPVIIVTGQGDEKIAVNTMKNGAADYVVKEHNYLSTLPKTINSVIERHKLQQTLKEKEDFLSSVVENANDIIFSLDQDFNFRFVNHKIEKLNYVRDELIGKSFFSILSQKHSPDDIAQILSNPEEKNYEIDFVDKNGRKWNQIVSFTRLKKVGDKYTRILGIAKDISETFKLHRLVQESKSKLQTLFDSITDYIVVLDKERNIVMANKKVASLKNTTPDRILGEKCYEYYYHSFTPCQGCVVEKTWQTLQPEFMERSQEDRIYNLWTYPMFDLEGELEYVIEYTRDVTEQKGFERKLIQSEKLATIGLLASGVAHELRNPLNIIETARYYLQEVYNNQDQNVQSKLQIIKRNVNRASNIINNLLEFSRHSSNDREPIKINELIDKTLSLIEKDLQSQSIHLNKYYTDVPKAFLNIDSLKQVFLNIIINSIQAMPEGGELTIYTQFLDQKWIEVKFSDNGPGIPQHHLNHIFTPFFTTKRIGGGTGLGMYICHSIIKKEGGDILVDSTKGEGTTFTVLLPVDGMNADNGSQN